MPMDTIDLNPTTDPTTGATTHEVLPPPAPPAPPPPAPPVTHSFSPYVIMGRPDTLARLTNSYFHRNPDTPTPAGLAMHLGFSSTAAMLTAAAQPNTPNTPTAPGAPTASNTPGDHPPESTHYLMRALTQIEDMLSQAALKDDVNVPFVKFMFSSRLGIVPKTEVVKDPEANKISINILGISTPTTITQTAAPTATQPAAQPAARPQPVLEDLL